MSDIAAPAVVPLSYETHPDLSRLTRADLPWLRQSWEGVEFWERCRGQPWQLVGFLMMIPALRPGESWGLALAAVPIIILEILKLVTRNADLRLLYRIWTPVLYLPAFLNFVILAIEPTSGAWAFVLAICSSLVIALLLTPAYLRAVASWRELSRVPLPPSFMQWAEVVKKQKRLGSSEAGLPRVYLPRGGLNGPLVLARAGEVLITYVGHAIYFNSLDEASLALEGPLNANAASRFRLTVGERGWPVRLFEKDRLQFQALLTTPA